MNRRPRRNCALQQAGEVAERYQVLIQATLDLLRLADKRTTNSSGKSVLFSQTSLAHFLRSRGADMPFREHLARFIIGPMPTNDEWLAAYRSA